MNTNKTNWLDVARTVGTFLTGIALVVLVLYLFGVGVAPEAPIERGFSTACYNASPSNVTADSGCTWNVKSGATLTVDSGATETHANGVTFSGTVTNTGTVVNSGSPTFSGAVTINNSLTVTGTLLATGDISGTATLAGNPTGVTNTLRVASTSGILFEGATADAIESLIAVTDPTSSDKTFTFPDASGTVVLTGQTANVDATMIANITRTVTIGLTGFQNCGASALIDWTSAADANPDFALVNGSPAIAYDATGGSVDTAPACNGFSIPTDYASSGYFKVSVTQGAATATNQESVSCTVGIEGAAQGSAGVTNLVNQTAWQSVTVVPAGTYAAGDSVGINCKQGNSSADDTVNILSVQFEYVAIE